MINFNDKYRPLSFYLPEDEKRIRKLLKILFKSMFDYKKEILIKYSIGSLFIQARLFRIL
jgi:hypothetical protein